MCQEYQIIVKDDLNQIIESEWFNELEIEEKGKDVPMCLCQLDWTNEDRKKHPEYGWDVIDKLHLAFVSKLALWLRKVPFGGSLEIRKEI